MTQHQSDERMHFQTWYASCYVRESSMKGFAGFREAFKDLTMRRSPLHTGNEMRSKA